MYDPTVLPQQLKKGRDYRNLTTKAVAAHLKKHFTTYNKWEIGENQPNAIELAKVAELENLDIGFFFTPGMSARDADREFNAFTGPLETATARLKELSALAGQEEDRTIRTLKRRDEVRDIVEIIAEWSTDELKELKALIYGYFKRQVAPLTTVEVSSKKVNAS